jgi:ATP-binding cassette, subfamily B, bacterial PglK
MDRQFFYKCLELLNKPARKRGLLMILLLLLHSVVEFFSIAAFLPVLIVIIQPQSIHENSVIRSIYVNSNFSNHTNFVVAATVSVVIFVFIKTQISGWITFKKASYAYGIANDLASRALTKYFQTSYKNFTNTDFTKEMNRISNLPLTFSNNIIISAGTFFVEVIISVILIVCIALFNFQALLFLVILAGPAAVIYIHKRKQIKAMSARIKQTYPQLLKYTLQAVEGLTEIKTFRKEHFFKKRFNKTYADLTSVFSVDHTLNTSTSRTTEFVSALLIGALICYVVISDQSYEQGILLLTVYAGVSFRVIPSVNRIFTALLQIRSKEYVVDELHQLIAEKDETFEVTGDTIQFRDKVELKNIYADYGDQNHGLKDLSIIIKKGQRVRIKGKSGAGKTTLLLLLQRLIQETRGNIFIDGEKLTVEKTADWQKLIGYVPQNPYIMDASIAENIAFGIPEDEIDYSRLKQLISQMDLQPWVDTLKAGAQTVIGEKGTKISGGQRQRLAIARALYRDAEILLLDEATNQLDRRTEEEILNLVINGLDRDKTVIVVCHTETVHEFDVTYTLTDGKAVGVSELHKME